MMNDARYPNGPPTPPAENGSQWRGLLAGIGSLTAGGAILLFIAGAFILLAEAALPPDHKLRPANLYSALIGDTQAGILDRVRATDAKWKVVEQDAIAKIQRETVAATKAMEIRIYDRERRTEAVDRHQLPTLIRNIVGEMACLQTNHQQGRIMGRCRETEELRSHIMEERAVLIGERGLLFSNEQLMSRIGLPADFMEQFQPARGVK